MSLRQLLTEAGRKKSQYEKRLEKWMEKMKCFSSKTNTDNGSWDLPKLEAFFMDWIGENKSGAISPTAIKSAGSITITLLKILDIKLPLNSQIRFRKMSESWAKTLAHTRLFRVKKAPLLTERENKEFMTALWTNNPTNRSEKMRKSAATILIINATAGSRTGDLLSLWWDDIKFVNNRDGFFVNLRLRAGKGNMFGKRPDQIVLCKKQNNFTYYCAVKTFFDWYKFCGSPKRGKIFPNMSTSLFNYHMRMAAKQLKFPAKRAPRGHSGRNAVCSILAANNVSETDIKIFLRWAPNSVMPAYYRGFTLESTRLGCASLIAEKSDSGDTQKLLEKLISS